MKTSLIAIASIWMFARVPPAQGADISKMVASTKTFGHWEVIEFALPKALIFRLATISVNYAKATITIDFPADCHPGPVVMNWNVGGNADNAFKGGFEIFAYKIPREKEDIEIVRDQMSADDTFAFFPFKKLTAQRLYAAPGRGDLAIWIPASGDGTVKRSENIYFSLKGFTSAYDQAKGTCMDNR